METGNRGTGLRRLAGTGRTRMAVLAGAGAAAAAAIVGLAVPAGAAPVAAGPAVVKGAEHFQIMSTSTTSNKSSIITWGVFTAAGVDIQGSGTVDTVVLPKGSFKVVHTNPQGGTFNPKTCFFQFNGKGTFKLTGGKGIYKGISGSGKFTVSVIGIGPKLKNGTCNPSQNAAPIAQHTQINAAGTVKLP
jgi:hypothetical protein